MGRKNLTTMNKKRLNKVSSPSNSSGAKAKAIPDSQSNKALDLSAFKEDIEDLDQNNLATVDKKSERVILASTSPNSLGTQVLNGKLDSAGVVKKTSNETQSENNEMVLYITEQKTGNKIYDQRLEAGFMCNLQGIKPLRMLDLNGLKPLSMA